MDGEAGRPVSRGAPNYEVRVDDELPQSEVLETRREKPDKAPQDQDDPKPQKRTPRWRRLLYWVIGLALLAAAITAGVLYWLNARHFESTDDAFIDGHVSQISARVAGRVERIAVEDYQHVKAGQLLVALDPRDFQAKLDQALAQRAQASAEVQQATADLTNQRAAVDQAEANLRVAEADLARAKSDFSRYQAVDPKAVSRQQVETASTTARSAQAHADAARQAISGAAAGVQIKLAAIEAARANLKAADAAVENAQLQVSYAQITAPRDGQVAKRTVELGNFVNPGQALLAVVGDDRWVTANFKETQLAAMQPGQHADLEVDACPGGKLAGTVLQIQPGSGSVFSALPAENATGNYVKVVQRIPVRIEIDHLDQVTCHIVPGMSVVPSVKVR